MYKSILCLSVFCYNMKYISLREFILENSTHTDNVVNGGGGGGEGEGEGAHPGLGHVLKNHILCDILGPITFRRLTWDWPPLDIVSPWVAQPFILLCCMSLINYLMADKGCAAAGSVPSKGFHIHTSFLAP